jgi:pyruvate,water dikinase
VAIVTDAGGILSHCAVVAREYRIPAVVGTGVATSRIKDGQLLEVDGTAGVVHILS